MTLATLAGNLVDKHQVKILDLDLYPNYLRILFDKIKNFKPDIVASSAKTTEYFAVREIMRQIKKKFPKVKTIVGGVHITAFPKEVAAEECFDIVVIGEGDTTIPEILSTKSLSKVPGLAYREGKNKKVHLTARRELIQDINKLPYPAWHLFNLTKYNNSRLSSRKNPVGHLETSTSASGRLGDQAGGGRDGVQPLLQCLAIIVIAVHQH